MASVKIDLSTHFCGYVHVTQDTYEENEMFDNQLELFSDFLLVTLECREACVKGEGY